MEIKVIATRCGVCQKELRKTTISIIQTSLRSWDLKTTERFVEGRNVTRSPTPPPLANSFIDLQKQANEILHADVPFKTLPTSRTEADAVDSVDCANQF